MENQLALKILKKQKNKKEDVAKIIIAY
jgi:hypothetical protein